MPNLPTPLRNHDRPSNTVLTPFSRAPAVPELTHTDDSVTSLVDVDSPHISSVPSDYESQDIKTETQKERIEHEAETTERETKEAAEKAAQKAKDAASASKAKSGRAAHQFRKNSDNPVVIGNLVLGSVVATALGVGAYKKYTAGEFSWKLAGAWAGVVGLFGVTDYYVSQ
jgi:hypothetical protein